MKAPRFIFKVTIEGQVYNVYDIEGREHLGLNDTPKTWWIYYGEEIQGVLPPPDSDSFVAWNVSINRRIWDIRIHQTNTSKQKWGETDFRSHTSVEMWCNDKKIYCFGTVGGERGISFAMAKIQYLQTILSEHPYDFFDAEKENGRKICYYGLPATIEVKRDTWEINIVADYSAGLTKDQWWKELARRESKVTKLTDDDADDLEIDRQDRESDQTRDKINWGEALSDQHIYWFRK